MCGIIGGIAQRNIVDILVEGLRRLEYRGYDSSGIAIIDKQGNIKRLRRLGKVKILTESIKYKKFTGNIGIAHTRWATHGTPSEKNAHPHASENIFAVHNGIIENYNYLRTILISYGYQFTSETDTEVLVHLIHWKQNKYKKEALYKIILRIIPMLQGTYSSVIMDYNDPSKLLAICSGTPLVIGCGIEENFIASDQLALLPITQSFIYLKEGDIARITHKKIKIINQNGDNITRKKIIFNMAYNAIDKGKYKHYMQKEIFEQAIAVKKTFMHYNINGNINFSQYNKNLDALLFKTESIKIVACGTSYNAGMVARYWLEELASMPCDVEIASEFRYRKLAVQKNCLLIILSQSGETADILAALRLSKNLKYLGSLSICNVEHSSLVRESDFALITQAGTEISVASTKSFTAQLTILLMLVEKINAVKSINIQNRRNIIQCLKLLPMRIEQVLSELNLMTKILSKKFSDKNYVLFLGRGNQYPIAMEGALKLKEISYIHAEAYAAGELKHGPLALISTDIPVIVIAPNNYLLKKLKSNIEEIRTRGGILYIFTDKKMHFKNIKNINCIHLPKVEEIIAPIIYVIPLQLLSYHIAVMKGTDVDQPRNLAKSVTVE